MGVICAFIGLGMGNITLMPWSMLPDVMEYDELQCGYRREGIFYSWFVFVLKIGLGCSLGSSSLVRGWKGHISPDNQTAMSVPAGTLRALVSFVQQHRLEEKVLLKKLSLHFTN
jgi:glycoside/pentoside/hexuronide:cation symporter, GPH family